ncbi:MAG: hypothetical protein AAGE94_22635 [Acidobacteriota bacterium]
MEIRPLHHGLVALLAMLALTSPAIAGTVLRVDPTGPASFTVEYEKSTRIGGIDKAMEEAEQYARALCESAGFAWYRVLDRAAVKSKFSLLPTRGDVAAVEVEFLDEDGEDEKAKPCTGSRKKDLRKMAKWLKALDYERPAPDGTPDANESPD